MSKLRQRIGMLRILRHHLPNEVLKLVADAIFTSKVRYGIAIYCRPKLGDENEGNHVLNELKKLQNIMLRVIAGKKISDKVSSKKLREKFKGRAKYLFSSGICICFKDAFDLEN